MAQREIVFVNDNIYHVFNRAINDQPIFKFQKNCQRALETIVFYQLQPLPVSLSHYLKVSDKEKKLIDKLLTRSKKRIDILSFCLMPSHFHFLLRQRMKGGVSKFISNFQNSYTRYFNIFHKRRGHIFEGQFKAVRIKGDEQLLHVSRYIHLNPHSSYIVKNFEQLIDFPWSSLGDYLNLFDNKIIEKRILLSFFPSVDKFKEFVFNQKDYQRELQYLKHLILET